MFRFFRKKCRNSPENLDVYKRQQEPSAFCSVENSSDVVIAISKDFMGNGSEELGKLLIKGFVYTSSEYEKLPKTMVFFNGGVKLTSEGSPCIDDLKKLEEKGVEIISVSYTHLL